MAVCVLMGRRVDRRHVRPHTVGIVVGSVAMVGVVTGRVVMVGAVSLIGAVPLIRLGAGRAGDVPVFRGQMRMYARVRERQPRSRHRGEKREQGREDAKLAGTDHDGS